jgi:hypothetical protein
LILEGGKELNKILEKVKEQSLILEGGKELNKILE